MGKRIWTVTLLLAMTAVGVMAQMVDPVHFKSELKTAGNKAQGEIVFTATIDQGWHVYSTDLGQDGPIEATFNVVKADGVEPIGKLKPKGNLIKKFDEMFGMELKYFENTATFVQEVKFTKPEYTIDCYLEYGACNDKSCMPPMQVELKQKGKSPIPPEQEKKAEEPEPTSYTVPDGSPLGKETAADTVPDGSPVGKETAAIPLTATSDEAELWHPVIDELRAEGGTDTLADHSLLYLLLMGFVGGLLAVCMPCIWPIIPMTVSFFLKRSKTDKRKGIRDAVTYGLSIVVIYLALGLIVTALFGSDTLNAMSTNAVFNIFLFLMLVVFALSFFGWFEIKLPDSWANSVDTKASSTTGLLSIFLMAFTLVLVSFSCTAPIIGLLLVETTTSGNWIAPAVGMFGFALALALPFTLFALFPSWLKQAPKSGSWMTTLKVVLGFIELAFALKFFSVADLAYGWHLMDREVFLSLWIVIFGLLGAYLCGWLKFQEDEVGGDLHKPMPVVCIMGGLLSLAFAVYMVPGLWGAPCKAISAFAPPMNTQDFRLSGGYSPVTQHRAQQSPRRERDQQPTANEGSVAVEARFTDYEQGMAAARAEGKPAFIDFTGFGCVNCRKMEAAVWTDPRVAHMLRNDFVLISLYVDDKTPLDEPFEVKDRDGKAKKLSTVGAKWSYLQSHKFGANAQPFYVIVDPVTGKPLCGSRAYDEDIESYLDFLHKGLNNYRK